MNFSLGKSFHSVVTKPIRSTFQWGMRSSPSKSLYQVAVKPTKRDSQWKMSFSLSKKCHLEVKGKSVRLLYLKVKNQVDSFLTSKCKIN